MIDLVEGIDLVAQLPPAIARPAVARSVAADSAAAHSTAYRKPPASQLSPDRPTLGMKYEITSPSLSKGAVVVAMGERGGREQG